MKKFLLILAVMLTATTCPDDYEVEGMSYFDNLTECSITGIYEGKITVNEDHDRIGMWCEITNYPDDVSEESIAPHRGDWVYLSRRVFRNYPTAHKTAIKFRILGMDCFPPEGFPYTYTLFTNRVYYLANIEITEITINYENN